MKYRSLPNAPEIFSQVSEMGLGCWQLGGGDWGEVDDELALAILTQAVESGVTFLDTADVYGGGRSEELIGRLLKNLPASVTQPIRVATKLGRTSSLYPDQYSLDALRAATEQSLRRLGVEALDLTQLHCIPTEVLRRGEVFDWLRTLQSEGKIKCFGASVESMEEALICLKQEGLVSLQIIFNLFRQRPIQTLFEPAQEKGIGIIVRLPLASGLLSGKLKRDRVFASSDHRLYNRDGAVFNVGETFAGLPFEKGVELADELSSFVLPGWTMAQMAQRWILDFKAVTTVITGASSVAQVTENSAISEFPSLSSELHSSLSEFYNHKVTSHIRGPY